MIFPATGHFCWGYIPCTNHMAKSPTLKGLQLQMVGIPWRICHQRTTWLLWSSCSVSWDGVCQKNSKRRSQMFKPHDLSKRTQERIAFVFDMNNDIWWHRMTYDDIWLWIKSLLWDQDNWMLILPVIHPPVLGTPSHLDFGAVCTCTNRQITDFKRVGVHGYRSL